MSEGVNPEETVNFGPGGSVSPVSPGYGQGTETGKINTGDHEGTCQVAEGVFKMAATRYPRENYGLETYYSNLSMLLTNVFEGAEGIREAHEDGAVTKCEHYYPFLCDENCAITQTNGKERCVLPSSPAQPQTSYRNPFIDDKSRSCQQKGTGHSWSQNYSAPALKTTVRCPDSYPFSSAHGDPRERVPTLSPGQYNDTTPWKEFLHRFESCAEANYWSEKTMIVQLKFWLVGAAGAIVHRNPRSSKWDYRCLVDELEIAYGPSSDHASAVAVELRQRPSMVETLLGVGPGDVPVLGEAQLAVDINNRQVDVDFLVADIAGAEVLLGHPFLTQAGARLDFGDHRVILFGEEVPYYH
ncbi:hypothetical protein CRENBAI_013776 [Crenichthys baileyi]|uniref:Uncharacterized protein n=1 Tax=Crenichthys baileyi TaxID=28760 RepID=A0AAV9SQ25_9TELE